MTSTAWMTEEVKYECQRTCIRCLYDIQRYQRRLHFNPNDNATRNALADAWEEYNLNDSILKDYPKGTLDDKDWADAEGVIADILGQANYLAQCQTQRRSSDIAMRMPNLAFYKDNDEDLISKGNFRHH